MDTNGSIRSSPQTTHGRGREIDPSYPAGRSPRVADVGLPEHQLKLAGLVLPTNCRTTTSAARLAQKAQVGGAMRLGSSDFVRVRHVVDLHQRLVRASCSSGLAEYRQTSGRSAGCDIRQRITWRFESLRGLPNVPNIIPLIGPRASLTNCFWGGAPAGEENFSWEVARVYPPLTFGIFGNSTYPYEYFQKILPNMTSGKVPDVSGHSARDPVLNWSTDAASSGPWRSLADC